MCDNDFLGIWLPAVVEFISWLRPKFCAPARSPPKARPATRCLEYVTNTIQMQRNLYRQYRRGDASRHASLRHAIEARQGNRTQKTDVNDRPFLAIMLALVVLLALASWQFYSLSGW